MPSLNGKTALVTGASRGMGRASALALATAGAQVLVHYGRGAKEANGVVAEIRKAGGRADAIATDLATADGVGKLAKQTRSIIGDRLDILVANAGISKAGTIEEMTVQDFDKLFAVNVRAPYFLVQLLLPVLGDGSSVILVSSLGAHTAVGTLSAYAATKGAMQVAGLSLDALVERENVQHIDFLKMNIEGAETMAIRGMDRTLRITRALCIACHDFRADAGEGEFFRTMQLIQDCVERAGFRTISRQADARPDIACQVNGVRD